MNVTDLTKLIEVVSGVGVQQQLSITRVKGGREEGEREREREGGRKRRVRFTTTE